MKQKIWIAIGIVVVLLGAVFIYQYSERERTKIIDQDPVNTNQSNTNTVTENPNGEVPGDPEEDPLTPSSDTIAISTQVPGSSVTVDNVFLSKPGFVTIHTVDEKGQAGNIIAISGLLGTGAKQDLEVSAQLTPGAKYIAQLRMDNGDKKFNANSDTPVLNNNIPIMVMFSVSQ